MYVTFNKDANNSTTQIPLGLVNEGEILTTQIHTLKAGQPLFYEGDKSEFVYQVLEGLLRTTKVMANGRRQVLTFGYPDDIVGLSHDCCYHNDCEAVVPTKILVLKKNAYSINNGTDQVLFDRLLKLAACEVSNMQEHFMMLGRKSAIEKIASFLLAIGSRTGHVENGRIAFNLPMKRSDIADFLGLTIETVSRVLTQLRKDGLIDLKNPHEVSILKKNALCELADSDD